MIRLSDGDATPMLASTTTQTAPLVSYSAVLGGRTRRPRPGAPRTRTLDPPRPRRAHARTTDDVQRPSAATSRRGTDRATGAPSRGPLGLDPPRRLPLTAHLVAVTAVSGTIRPTPDRTRACAREQRRVAMDTDLLSGHPVGMTPTAADRPGSERRRVLFQLLPTDGWPLSCGRARGYHAACRVLPPYG
jgi:hypothetical protein